MSDINDYLIDQNGKDWSDLLDDWSPLFPAGSRLWLVNRLGDPIIAVEDGSIYFLEVGAGTVKRIADSRDDFAKRLDQGNNAEGWLAISLVDGCVAAGMKLDENQCYSYRVPPFLGGEYAVENLEPTALSVHYHLFGQIWQQVKNLPDGTPIGTFSISD